MVLLLNMKLSLGWVLGWVEFLREYGLTIEKRGIDLEGVVPELVVGVCESQFLELFHIEILSGVFGVMIVDSELRVVPEFSSDS